MKSSVYPLSPRVLIVLGFLLAGCAPQSVAPTQEPTAAPAQVEPAGPELGTLMSWVDGSTLAYFLCNESGAAPEYMWVYQSEVTNYQLSLCMEAGTCKLPAGESSSPDFENPDLANSTAQIIGPDVQQQYCGWAGGRLPTEEEAAQMNANGVYNGVDSTAVLIGLLSPASEHGFRCIVDAPHPIAPACQTSAFYLNGPPAEMELSVSQAGAFCQNGQSLVTLDINTSEGGSLQSVNGDCQVVGDNRLLCSGAPGSSGGGEAFFVCNELPAVQGNFAPGQMQCLPGYEVNGDSPAQCTIIGPEQSSRGPSTGQVSLIEYKSETRPFQNDPPYCGPLLHYDEISGHCILQIELANLAPAILTRGCEFGFSYNEKYGTCLPDMSGWTPPVGQTDCGIGYTYDEGAGVCMPDKSTSPSPSRCLGGMRFNETSGMCEPDTSGWRPPSGQTTCGPFFRFDIATGVCVTDLDTSGIPSPPRCLGGMRFNETSGMCEPDTSGWRPPSGRTDCGAWFRFDVATRTCVPDVHFPASPPACFGGLILNTVTGLCEVARLGCPIGTYFDPGTQTCIAPQAPTLDTLTGFHFVEALLCSLTDLPSGRYPGCPPGQTYNPSIGACDSEHLWQAGGVFLETYNFTYDLPVCSTVGGDSASCSSYTDQSSCNIAGCKWDNKKMACN